MFFWYGFSKNGLKTRTGQDGDKDGNVNTGAHLN